MENFVVFFHTRSVDDSVESFVALLYSDAHIMGFLFVVQEHPPSLWNLSHQSPLYEAN